MNLEWKKANLKIFCLEKRSEKGKANCEQLRREKNHLFSSIQKYQKVLNFSDTLEKTLWISEQLGQESSIHGNLRNL